MVRLVADTHALVWYLFDDPRLSPPARDALIAADESGEAIGVSSISLVEIVYLVEKGRLQPGVLDRILEELDRRASALEEIALDRRVVAALRQIERSRVPDLPDRAIAATASALGVPLVTKDPAIRSSGVLTIW